MRVIGGHLGGRSFASPKTRRTHPMSDRIRGGLFNALGDVEGLSVLDAFAGSGALGIEAISRGASSVVSIEADKTACRQIIENAKQLGLSNLKAVNAFVSTWSNNNPDKEYDLVLADPPYTTIPYKDVTKLVRHLKSSGTLVLSWPGRETALSLDGLEVIKCKNYGDSQLVFYRKIS